MKIVTPLEALELISTEAESVLIDVRQESEWRNGYPDIDNAGKSTLLLTITADLDDFCDRLKQHISDLSKPILFLCYAGHRSATAAIIAEKIGYLNCYNITGGFAEWQKLSLPFKKKEA